MSVNFITLQDTKDWQRLQCRHCRFVFDFDGSLNTVVVEEKRYPVCPQCHSCAAIARAAALDRARNKIIATVQHMVDMNMPHNATVSAIQGAVIFGQYLQRHWAGGQNLVDAVLMENIAEALEQDKNLVAAVMEEEEHE